MQIHDSFIFRAVMYADIISRIDNKKNVNFFQQARNKLFKFLYFFKGLIRVIR